MSSYLRRRSRPETDAERIARLDREAIRAYRTNRYAGGIVTDHYRRDLKEMDVGPIAGAEDTDEPGSAK